jgi:hypothetical protein
LGAKNNFNPFAALESVQQKPYRGIGLEFPTSITNSYQGVGFLSIRS